MKAHWFTQHEQGGFPVERGYFGSCELSALHIGGEWQWLVRQEGRDVAEGSAPSADAAKAGSGSRGGEAARPGPVNFGKPGLVRPVAVDSGSSKTPPENRPCAGSNTSVLKSKGRCPHRLPGFTAGVFDDYLKKFSTMYIISRSLRENQTWLHVLRVTAWRPFRHTKA